MTQAICIGECMVELRACGDALYERRFAGDAYNTAVYLKRSAPAANVVFCTATGDDPLSRQMRDHWQEEGLDASLAFTVSGHTPGLYLIEVDTQGDRKFYYWRKNSSATLWWQALRAHDAHKQLGGVDLLYLSGISLAILSPSDRVAFLSELRELSAAGKIIAFDPNLRLSLWASLDEARSSIEAAIAVSSIVLPSCQDMDVLYTPAAPQAHIERLTMLGAHEIALTSDTKGCWIYNGTVVHVPPEEPVIACDTSGAGDSFNGAYLAAKLEGKSARQAAEAGLHLAGTVVTHAGAIIDIHAMDC